MNLLEIIKELFSRPLVLWAAALAAGIAAGGSEEKTIYILMAVIICAALVMTVKFEKKAVHNRRFFIIFIFFLSFLVGNIRIRDGQYALDAGIIPETVQKNTEIIGDISEMSLSGDKILVVVENPKIKLKNEYKNRKDFDLDGKMLVYSEAVPEIGIGDEIVAKGSLYPFNEATNYGQFDQRKYYYAKGIYLKLYSDEIKSIKKNESLLSGIKDILYNVSVAFQNGLGKIFDENKKGILSAMLTGNKSEIDEDTKDIYKRIGIAHILSISGLHITLLGLGLFRILLKITNRLNFSIYFSLIFIFLYGLLTGFPISTQRAVIMMFCMLIGRLLFRVYDGQSAAGLAAIIILTINPSEIFETGFLLSFFAVFGIFAGNEIRVNLQIKNPILKYIFPGLSAQIATFPLILRTYYSFSPYSFIANPILLPFMSIIIMSGIIAGIFGVFYILSGTEFFYAAGCIAGGPADFFLCRYEETAEKLLSLPFSDIICGCPTVAGCVIYYILLFFIVTMSSWLYFGKRKLDNFADVKKNVYIYDNKIGNWVFDKNHKYRLYVSEAAAIFLVLCLMSLSVLFRIYENGIYVGFIDVGQGLSVYVKSENCQILADGGSSNVKDVGKYRIEPFLLWKGCSELDYVLISHTDADHISGIKELIKNDRIKIKQLLIGTNYDDSEELISLAKAYDIAVTYVKAGDRITDGSDFVIDILAPDSEFIYEDKNQASMVAKIHDGNFGLLFTGDSDIFSESEYVKYLNTDESIDVLQCPHHGSKYSSSELMLNKAKPKIAVISCSKTNSYGHPHIETLERLQMSGCDAYNTAESGMITIVYDRNGKFKVTTYLK